MFGATGYSGREIVRLLRQHPRAGVAFTTGSGAGHLDHEAGLDVEADAYLLALPHGVAARYAARLREARPDAVVVDLSGDLRLPDTEAYARWYGQEHPAPELLGQAVFGLSEVYRDRLRGARLVSNPGCYATSVLLPLVPAAARGSRRARRHRGRRQERGLGGGPLAEGEPPLLRGDRRLLRLLPGPHPPPRRRDRGGAEGDDRARPRADLLPAPAAGEAGHPHRAARAHEGDAGRARRTLVEAYDGAPFVHVVDAPPRLGDVVLTNDCRISVHAAASGRAVVFSAIDNLVKGAAGQAIQNLNLAMGWDEDAGLPSAFGTDGNAT